MPRCVGEEVNRFGTLRFAWAAASLRATTSQENPTAQDERIVPSQFPVAMLCSSRRQVGSSPPGTSQYDLSRKNLGRWSLQLTRAAVSPLPGHFPVL